MVEINSKKILKGLLLLLFVTFLLPASNAFGVIATVTASNDTTIYQGPVPDDVDGLADNNSCGAGSNIIAGTTDIGKNGGAFPSAAVKGWATDRIRP